MAIKWSALPAVTSLGSTDITCFDASGVSSKITYANLFLGVPAISATTYTPFGSGVGQCIDTLGNWTGRNLNPNATGRSIGGSTPYLNLTLAGTATIPILKVASGTNQRVGNAVLVGGTVTVANTTVTANTVIMLTRMTSGGTIGTAITYTVSAGVSFTINSDNPLDTSTFTYFLIENP